MPKGPPRRQRNARDAGAVATEFALLMAFLPLPILAFGIVDYGEIMAQATNLSAIIRGAAEYARGQVVQGNALPTAANLNTLLGCRPRCSPLRASAPAPMVRRLPRCPSARRFWAGLPTHVRRLLLPTVTCASLLMSRSAGRRPIRH